MTRSPRQHGLTLKELQDEIRNDMIASGTIRSSYSWAATYSAGSDAMVYRRFKGALPAYAAPYAQTPPASVVAFCEEHSCDVALYDELRGVTRKPKLGTDEAP